jgi:hypothetical protein
MRVSASWYHKSRKRATHGATIRDFFHNSRPLPACWGRTGREFDGQYALGHDARACWQADAHAWRMKEAPRFRSSGLLEPAGRASGWLPAPSPTADHQADGPDARQGAGGGLGNGGKEVDAAGSSVVTWTSWPTSRRRRRAVICSFARVAAKGEVRAAAVNWSRRQRGGYGVTTVARTVIP